MFKRNTNKKAANVERILASGTKEEKRQLLQDSNEDAVILRSAIALAEMGDLQRGEAEEIIGRIRFWSFHPTKLMKLANVIEQKYPELAASMLRKLWDSAPGDREEIIAALKRLKASKHMIEIVKSQKSLSANYTGKDEFTVSFNSTLDQINVEVHHLDQVVKALFELGDKQALSELSDDVSVFPYLREQAKRYLEKLNAG
ncbi:MAG: hypothetical protein WHV66_02680 [Anaerolineales bacterium]